MSTFNLLENHKVDLQIKEKIFLSAQPGHFFSTFNIAMFCSDIYSSRVWPQLLCPQHSVDIKLAEAWTSVALKQDLRNPRYHQIPSSSRQILDCCRSINFTNLYIVQMSTWWNNDNTFKFQIFHWCFLRLIKSCSWVPPLVLQTGPTGCTITENAPTRAFSWLKAHASASTFKTLWGRQYN